MGANPAKGLIRIARAEWQRRPWLNGRGWSHSIWDGEDPDLPDLQILRTPIAEPAPFSNYAGWNRIFTVIAGKGLELTIEGLPRRRDHLRLSGSPARPWSASRFPSARGRR